MCNRDITVQKIETERQNFLIFDRPFENFLMNMPKYFSENYGGDGRTFIDKEGNEKVSSYRLLLAAHNSSAFDSWVVLNALAREITDIKL